MKGSDSRCSDHEHEDGTGRGTLSNELGESHESCFNILMEAGNGNLRIKKRR